MQVVLALPPDPATGQQEYCVHWQRELRSNWKTLFVLLTGRDASGNEVDGLEPTTWWKQILTLTKSDKRPHGIKGSPATLSKKACRCLAGACISQCSCPHCTTFFENLDHRHLAIQCGWRKKKADDDDVCRKCGGGCHDRHGAWLKMSGGLIPFTRHILCPAITVPGVFVSAIDPTTGLEIPGQQSPIKMIPKKCWLGLCSKCGWDNRFAQFPLLPLTLKEDGQPDREVFVRACPREARTDANTTYHQFLKMERGTTSDGKPYTQPEWTPVVADRRTFYYRLHQFMETFLPHYYKVRWHESFDQVFKQEYRRLAFLGMPDQPQAHASMKGWFIIIIICP